MTNKCSTCRFSSRAHANPEMCNSCEALSSPVDWYPRYQPVDSPIELIDDEEHEMSDGIPGDGEPELIFNTENPKVQDAMADIQKLSEAVADNDKEAPTPVYHINELTAVFNESVEEAFENEGLHTLVDDVPPPSATLGTEEKFFEEQYEGPKVATPSKMDRVIDMLETSRNALDMAIKLLKK